MRDYMYRQWSFVTDMNYDGIVTISDVWLWIKWLYYYPGDLFLYFLMQDFPRLAVFVEVAPESYSGSFSGIFSVFFWTVVIVVSYGIMKTIEDRGNERILKEIEEERKMAEKYEDLPEEEDVIPESEAKATFKCSDCGAIVLADSVSCPSCGEKFDGLP